MAGGAAVLAAMVAVGQLDILELDPGPDELPPASAAEGTEMAYVLTPADVLR